MIFDSICPLMKEDALKLPKDINVKVYMRHSIRFDDPVDGDYSNLLLTPEGIAIANRIGKNLDVPIGRIYASPVQRCVQTATEIARGAGITEPGIERIEAFAAIKGLRHAQEDLGIGWYQFYYGLQRDLPEYTGGVSLDEVALPIIDAVFSVPATEGKLDLICSHDGHVVILASELFDLRTGIKGENWCGFTEGIFFCGTRDDFTAYWRGKEKRFKNWKIG